MDKGIRNLNEQVSSPKSPQSTTLSDLREAVHETGSYQLVDCCAYLKLNTASYDHQWSVTTTDKHSNTMTKDKQYGFQI